MASKDFTRLFISGDCALKQGNYSEAVQIFEQLYQDISPNNSQYFNIQRGLVKAYQANKQIDAAIALCQQMIISDQLGTRIWGAKFLEQLAPELAQVITNSLSSLSDQKLLSKPDKVPSIKLKTLAEFKSYCQEHLLEDLKEFENKRKQTLSTIFISGFICLILPLLVFIVIQQFSDFFLVQLFKLTAWILVLVIICWLFFCQGCIQVYGLGFKSKIIAKIVDFIDENKQLTYASQLLLEDKRRTAIAFTESQLFQSDRQEPDWLEEEDCVSGKIGEIEIFFAEICAQNYSQNSWWRTQDNLERLKWQVQGRNSIINLGLQLFNFSLHCLISLVVILLKILNYSNGSHPVDYYLDLGNEKDKKTIFRGLFFLAKFPKHFQGHTIIIPMNVQAKFKPVNHWPGELVQLEDPEFNQLFCVYSSDQIEARYILSTNLMSRLVEFAKKAKQKVHLSFVAGKIYIAIKYNHNLFEPKLFQSMLSFAPLKEYFENFQLMIGIVQELNLNRNIWMKK